MIDWDHALSRRTRPAPPSRSSGAGRRVFLPCPSCGRKLAVYDGNPKECQRCRTDRGTHEAVRELRMLRTRRVELGLPPDPVPYNEFPEGY